MSMATATRGRKIDELMEKASESLAGTRYFEAERMAVKALTMARADNDFERMARIFLPLQETRRQRLQTAMEVGDVTIVTDPVTEESKIDAGVYLVQPPLVGADGRRLRIAAFSQESPVAVLCREPSDQLGLVPIVSLARGHVIRTKVDPPDDEENPDIAWIAQSMEDLGDWAIDCIDPEMDLIKRIDLLMDRLEAIPEHERLHQTLAAWCRRAHEASMDEGEAKPSRRRSRSSKKRGASEEE